MKVKSIAECSFCNTFELHKAIIGLENQLEDILRVAVLHRFNCIFTISGLMEFSINLHTIKSGWSIVYIEGSQVIISKIFFFLNIF